MPHFDYCLIVQQTLYRNGWFKEPLGFKIKLYLKIKFALINAGEGVEKRDPSYTVRGNVNWCSYYGKQCESSSEN